MSGTDYNLTPNLGLYKPIYDHDVEMWGTHLNANADVLDAALGPGGGVFLPIAGGTMAGPLSYTATGGTVARAAQDRASDRVNVLDFGAKGDGTTDDYAAICAARDSKPSGSEVNLWFPDNHTYYTSAAVPTNGRTLFFDVAPTSTLTGGAGAPFYNVAYGHDWQRQSHWQTYSGPPQGNQAVGPNYQVFNDGTGSGGSVGYGVRTSYTTSAAGVNGGFDLLRGDLMTVATASVAPGSQWMTHWLTLNSPADVTNGWGACVAEWNPNNRGPDTGWANARGSLAHWTGGLQISPGATDSSGAGKLCSSISFALGVMASGAANTNGNRVQVYNAVLVEQNAIGPGGRGVYLGGYVAGTGVPTTPPQTAMQVDYTWVNGVDLSSATFSGSAFHSPGFSVDGAGHTSAVSLIVPGAAGTSRATYFQTGTQNRWSVGADTDAEGTPGSNTGSSFVIGRYNDSGAWLNNVISIARAGGTVSVNSPLAVNNDLIHGSAGWLAFFGATTHPKQTVTGAKGGNAALGSLITALAAYGLVTDSTTA